MNDPGAGQTGSPVAPDHSSPGRFRPPVVTPPSGPSPTLPGRPLAPRRLTASHGAWLYTVTPGGLFAFDTSSAGAAPAQLLPETRPRWIGVEGSALSVIASVLPDDPGAVEQGQLTRLYRFDLSRDPGAPELLGSIDLPGQLALARLEAGRLVTLSAEYGAAYCSPEAGTRDVAYEPERFVVSDLRAGSGGWSLAGSTGVEAHGFIETESAFVLVRGGLFGQPSALTVVELADGALVASGTLNVGGEILPRAAMAVVGQRLALFQNTPSGLELQVHPLDGGAPSALSIAELQGAGDGVNAARFDGRFALLPRAAAEPPQGGVIIDWQREGGPAVTAQLPADIQNVERLGERWLGWGTERSVSFTVGEAGTFDVQRELGPPSDGLGLAVHWDAATQQVLLPYLRHGSGVGSAPAVYALSTLSLSAPEPAWRWGLALAGNPEIAAYDRVLGLQPGLHFQRTDAGWFALTDAGEVTDWHRLVEALELEAGSSQVLGFAERTITASLSEHGSARLLADYRGTRAVSVGSAEEPEVETAHLELGFGAERLERTAQGWLSYALGYSNPCGSQLFPGAVCLPSGKAALSQLGSDPPRVLHDTELPQADPYPRPPRTYTREWLEVVAQGSDVGLLAHRAVMCSSEAECDELGIEFEVDEQSGRNQCDENDAACLASAPEVVRRVRGNQNQRWLHPYDAGTGQFHAPVRLPDTDGYGWISASGLRVQDRPAFIWLDPLEIAADGYSVTRARIQLLRLPSLLGASASELERITVPGFPMYVAAEQAISIEPAGPLPSSGASVGARVHLLALRGGRAYRVQTLELPRGHTGHLWAEQRGYVLTRGDDRCANPSVTLYGVQLADDLLAEVGRLDLPGTSWELAQASDELVLLTRTVGDLNQHALIEVDAAGLTLRSLETRPAVAQVSVFADRAWFAP